MKLIFVMFSMLSVAFITPSCESDISSNEYYGVYRAEYKGEVDTLVIRKNLTYYHSVYIDNEMVFIQEGSFYHMSPYIVLKDYKEDSTVTTSGWDLKAFKTKMGKIKIAIDRDLGVFYEKVEDY